MSGFATAQGWDGIIRSSRDVAALVATYYGLPRSAVLGPCRRAHLVKARHVAMYLCRRRGETFWSIADVFGGRDHTTVIHACQKIKSLAQSDPSLRRDLKLLWSDVKSGLR